MKYRRWVRDGVLYWNEAFEKIGIDSAIEVYYQDEATGAHMEKDPEDVRYNFLPDRKSPLPNELLFSFFQHRKQ